MRTSRPPLPIEYPMAARTPAQKKKNNEPKPEPSTNTFGSWLAAKVRQLARPGTAGPLLLTCMCLAIAYKNRNKMWGRKDVAEPAAKQERPSTRPRHVLQRSVSMATLHGGKVALERMMDSQEARVDETTLEDAANQLPGLLAEEPYNFSKLQRCVAKLEMSGKEDEAVTMISQAWEKADKAGKTHEAYELQMLLVEMLIYKGEYEQALGCNCLKDTEISDARRPLYKVKSLLGSISFKKTSTDVVQAAIELVSCGEKAVIYTIEGDKQKAEECYKEFQDIRSRFHWPDALREGSPLYGVVHDFRSFERIVNNLKREIEHAHKNKQTMS